MNWNRRRLQNNLLVLSGGRGSEKVWQERQAIQWESKSSGAKEFAVRLDIKVMSLFVKMNRCKSEFNREKLKILWMLVIGWLLWKLVCIIFLFHVLLMYVAISRHMTQKQQDSTEKLSVYKLWVSGDRVFYLYVPGTKQGPGLCLLNKWVPYQKKINLRERKSLFWHYVRIMGITEVGQNEGALSKAVTSKLQARSWASRWLNCHWFQFLCKKQNKTL